MTSSEHDLKLGDKYIHETLFFKGNVLIRKEHPGVYSWYYSYNNNIECLCDVTESIFFENEYQKVINNRR